MQQITFITMAKHYLYILCLVLTALIAGCSSSSKKENSKVEEVKETPQVNFNGDSAYYYVKAQCDFGPRVPNTKAHSLTAEYLANELKRHGANVIVQEAKLNAFDGTILNAKNIIGEYNPQATQRILLLAHWDSRPWADNDPDKSKHKQSVMGANDGASGVGVLLEIARLMNEKKPNVGVDILFVDAEDWGNSNGDNEDSWALGTQYWVQNKHKKDYKPMFGILLDMVGAKDAQFYKEYFSSRYAQQINNMVWETAAKTGYGNYFVDQQGGGITDDHIFINKDGIPCIDIIDQNSQGSNSGFFPQWHTTHDTMENISAETLKAVGQTVTQIVYSF